MSLLPPPTHALVRAPAVSAPDGLASGANEPADGKAIREEHEAYVAALSAAGLELIRLDADESFPDGQFVEDVAVPLGPDLLVLTNPGAAVRRAEQASVAAALPHGQVRRITDVGGESATLDGGDVLIASDRVLIGISQRTNIAGAKAMARILAQERPSWPVSVVRVQGVLHLKSGLTEVAPGTVVRARRMRPPADIFALAGLDEIELEPGEAHAANVLPLGTVTLVASGAPRVERAAARAAEVVALPITHTVRMDGGLTCSSLRW